MTNLQGKVVKQIRKMTDKEAQTMGWFKKPHIIEFTDGTLLIPQKDDEGNDGGAFMFQGKTQKEDCLFGTY